MVLYIILAILLVVLAFVGVILVRTVRFKPKGAVASLEGTEEFDKNQAVENLRELVMCKTVSRYNREEEDEAAWEKPPFDGIIENNVLWGRGLWIQRSLSMVC